MSEVKLKINVKGSSTKDGDFILSGIPNDIWNRFRDKCSDMFPENPDGAWSEVITSLMLSMLDEEEQVILFNNIPREFYVKANETFKQAGSNLEGAIKEMLETASNGKLYAGVIKHEDKKVDGETVREVASGLSMVVIAGVPDETIHFFEEKAQDLNREVYAKTKQVVTYYGIDLLLQLLANAGSGSVVASMDVKPNDTPKGE